MTDPPNYYIELRAPGEEVLYSDGTSEYHLDVTWQGDKPTVSEDTYWDGKPDSTLRPLNADLREMIVPRIYDFLNTWGENTPVGVVFCKNPLTGAYERVSAASLPRVGA